MQSNERIRVLLDWCNANAVIIDARLTLVHLTRETEAPLSETTQEIAVYSMADSFIPSDTCLVQIPKASVLSVRNCVFAGHIPLVPYGIEAQLGLALALYVELLRGDKSRWHGYLQSLPDDTVALPLFWGLSRSEPSKSDGEDGLAWLRGTQTEKILQKTKESGQTLLQIINAYYHDIAIPVLMEHQQIWRKNLEGHNDPTLDGFHRAFSLVSSRAFLVDSYHGLSMVPIADAFNHVVENHIHLESDFSVCPDCGSIDECEHDRDEAELHKLPAAQASSSTNLSDGLGTWYEMVSNTAIPPHSEIFNTYGETLTNAQLLNQYGFVLDANENDYISWSRQELLSLLSADQDPESISIRLDRLLNDFPGMHPALNHSELIFWNDSKEDVFAVNSEGKISHQLWSLLFLLACRGPDLYPGLEQVLYTQLVLEGVTREDDDGSATHNSDSITIAQESSGVLTGIAAAIIVLTRTRKRNSGKEGFEEHDLSSILDDVPVHRARTRTAVTVLMSERSLGNSCEASWSDLLENVALAYSDSPS